jgi:hypothetical protein
MRQCGRGMAEKLRVGAPSVLRASAGERRGKALRVRFASRAPPHDRGAQLVDLEAF